MKHCKILRIIFSTAKNISHDGNLLKKVSQSSVKKYIKNVKPKKRPFFVAFRVHSP
jgi:hypothetical protein